MNSLDDIKTMGLCPSPCSQAPSTQISQVTQARFGSVSRGCLERVSVSYYQEEIWKPPSRKTFATNDSLTREKFVPRPDLLYNIVFVRIPESPMKLIRTSLPSPLKCITVPSPLCMLALILEQADLMARYA
jgi:hypothetical protein